MAPPLLLQPLNDVNGLSLSLSHTSHGQHPQHGHEGQLEQLMTPQIPFQSRSIQNTHQVQRWLEEDEVFQGFRDGHDRESQARFEDIETQFGRDEARIFPPFAPTQDYRDEQLDEVQELRGSQEMLTQPEEEMEQEGLRQERDGTIPSLATGFVHQPFQDLQNHHSPYDAHNPNAASSQVYFQQQPDQHGRQLTYQDIQHGDQDRRQNEGQPLQMGSSHAEGHKWKRQPSDDGVALLRRNSDQSHLPPSRDYPTLAWAHNQDEDPHVDLLPEQMAYSHPDQQAQLSSRVAAPVASSPYGMNLDTVSPWAFLPQQTAYGQPNHQEQQSMHTSQPQEAAYAQQPIWPSTSPDTQSWAAALVPSSPSGRDSTSPPLREDSPEQVANGRQDRQGQLSMYTCQPEQVAYGQQPIRDSTPPRILSRAATPIPSNPPGVDSDSVTHRQLRVRNNSFNLPSHLGRDDLIKQAKTGKPIQRVKKSKRSQKKPNPKGLNAGYAVETPPKTGLSAAKKHCPTCICTQAVSVAPAYDPPSEPEPPVRSSRKRRMHESSPQQPSLRRSTRKNAYKGPF